jgi:hypothetical protein
VNATLFVLLPVGGTVESLLAELQSPAAGGRLRVRLYPPARNGAHLDSLVRSGRDPAAVTWRAGAAKAVAAGALIGGLVNAVLAAGFGMLGGLLDIAVPLGIGGGAFMGGLSATMRGTERPRAEVRALLPAVTPGAALVTFSGDAGVLAELRATCRRLGLPTAGPS